MPVSRKHITAQTSRPQGAASESLGLEQEDFRQHLRRLAVSAVQVLIEQVMCEELEQCLGASWGECTPTRRGYRNGFYPRDLVTPTGRIKDLKVPRDREGGISKISGILGNRPFDIVIVPHSPAQAREDHHFFYSSKGSSSSTSWGRLSQSMT